MFCFTFCNLADCLKQKQKTVIETNQASKPFHKQIGQIVPTQSHALWSPLVTFFVKQSKKPSADKTSKDKASKIQAYMKEPTTKAYLYFLASVLGKVNTLNVKFQSGDTMIHTLITSFRLTLKVIMRCFMKLGIVNRSDAFELPLHPRSYKDVKDVLCDPNTEA